MSKNVNKSRWFLLLLTTASEAQGKALLHSIEVNQVDAISEIVHNLLQGNIKLSNALKVKLKKSKSTIRRVGSRQVSFNSRRTAIIKNKGLFITLLKALSKQLKLILE